jgi:hypothetical protein
VDDVVVVAVTWGAAFARDVARLFVTVCCDSVTVCDSTLAALGLRPGFFLGAVSGAGDADCELCLDADCEDSVTAAAAVRRVVRRVVVDIVPGWGQQERCAAAAGTYGAVAMQLPGSSR